MLYLMFRIFSCSDHTPFCFFVSFYVVINNFIVRKCKWGKKLLLYLLSNYLSFYRRPIETSKTLSRYKKQTSFSYYCGLHFFYVVYLSKTINFIVQSLNRQHRLKYLFILELQKMLILSPNVCILLRLVGRDLSLK